MVGLRYAHDLSQMVEGDPRLLARALARLDDVQIAAQLDNHGPQVQDAVLQALPRERRPEVLDAMRYESAAEVIERLAPEEAAQLLDELEVDDVADILQRLDDPSRLRSILDRLDPEDVEDVEDLLTYDPNSAGGIMTPDHVRVSDRVTVGEALRAVQTTDDLPDHVFYVYVVDEDDRLVGLVNLRHLVVSKPDTPVRDVMETDVTTVGVDTDQEVVADMASRYDVVAVPVVDAKQRLLGVVEIDDLVDVMREEATEDILKMAGAGEALADTRDFIASFKARLPWLMGAAVGGILVAISLSGFDDALREVPVLALFMPVVAGMGGNVGTQSSTVVVRGLAVGYMETKKFTRVVLREMGLGITLGILSGLLISVAASFMQLESSPDPLRLSLVLTGGLVGSMTIAATVGACVPLLLDRFNVDPAVATGPFVTTSVDVLGLLFYFTLAAYLLGISA